MRYTGGSNTFGAGAGPTLCVEWLYKYVLWYHVYGTAKHVYSTAPSVWCGVMGMAWHYVYGKGIHVRVLQ